MKKPNHLLKEEKSSQKYNFDQQYVKAKKAIKIDKLK